MLCAANEDYQGMDPPNQGNNVLYSYRGGVPIGAQAQSAFLLSYPAGEYTQ